MSSVDRMEYTLSVGENVETYGGVMNIFKGILLAYLYLSCQTRSKISSLVYLCLNQVSF